MSLGKKTGFKGPLVQAGGLQDDRSREGIILTNDADYVVEMIDFVNVGEYNSTDWTETVVDGGTDSAQSIAVSAANACGELVILNNDADDDSANLQKKVEAYRLTSGKKLWFESRVKVSDADACDFFVGLAITDTTALDASDRLGFRITDGDASIYCQAVKNTTATSTDSAVDAADDTYVKLAMIYDGGSQVRCYINGNLVVTLSSNLPDDENLAITLNITNGAAAAKSATVDYIKVVQER